MLDFATTDHNQIELECTNCHTRIALNKKVTGCPNCGENMLEARYDLSGINVQTWLAETKQRKHDLWRYREVLPIFNSANIISMGEGGTPLLKSQALAASLGLKNLYIKDERQGPTGSFKDRQATVAISALKEMGVNEVVVASTGNVAIAYAAYAARAGIKVWAFFPSLTPGDKMREAALYGAEVIKITGTYDQTKELAARFAKSKGIFLDRGIKSVAAIEAMKTIAYEIAEQLGDDLEGGERWRTPDWFLQGVSGGMGPIGVGKGFQEMMNFGLVDKMPAFGLIQSAGCAPMVEAFNRGQSIATPIENPQTIIATLATGNPGRAYELLYEYVQQYGGHFTSATDEEAFTATLIAARTEGISVEPATAVTFAGLIRMVREKVILPDDVVVVNCSGHTMSVEKHILGDQWQHSVELTEQHVAPTLPEEGLLSALQQVESNVRRIVIIEDNQDAARLIKRILQARGNYDIHLAADGAQGVQLVREVRPDMVITDLMMPDVDGFAVIETMKGDPTIKDIPIVVVTAKELTVKERARLSGQIEMLLQKGSFIDEEFIESLVNKLH
ncbi:MAG: threonine synthase [Chloroflexi bacterium]|nr:threonine synthase [Chloroflexota bacterium]MCC6892757.1 threonine synthase [Anaerolineae bacterium]